MIYFMGENNNTSQTDYKFEDNKKAREFFYPLIWLQPTTPKNPASVCRDKPSYSLTTPLHTPSGLSQFLMSLKISKKFLSCQGNLIFL